MVDISEVAMSEGSDLIYNYKRNKTLKKEQIIDTTKKKRNLNINGHAEMLTKLQIYFVKLSPVVTAQIYREDTRLPVPPL